MNKYKINDLVRVEPKANDTFNEFAGYIIGYRNGNVQVKDLDDNVYDCERESPRSELFRRASLVVG